MEFWEDVNQDLGFDVQPGSLAEFMRGEFPEEIFHLKLLACYEGMPAPVYRDPGSAEAARQASEWLTTKDRNTRTWQRLMEKLRLRLRSDDLYVTGSLAGERVSIPEAAFNSHLTEISLTKNTASWNGRAYTDLKVEGRPEKKVRGRPKKVDPLAAWIKANYVADADFIDFHRRDNFREIEEQAMKENFLGFETPPSLSTWKRIFDKLEDELRQTSTTQPE